MNIKIKKLSKKTKVSITTIYRYAKRFGRVPTALEINSMYKKNMGRPKKY